ncbi:hypothetical protein [uncultured Phyllobacterium sp.]|uniref:hypothetical protein n=1 Tax=uncultured Phyllobacterium sp. TaxID=253813 RepID=UPI00258E3499|nr:hypothetical protein [uncultured Phyllobacterium sp.]
MQPESQWAGRIFGTNTGNLFCQIKAQGAGLVATIRFMDDVYGLAIYEATGSFDGSNLELKGVPKQGPQNVELGPIVITGKLGPNGEIRGNWQSEIGTAGTFLLHPHNASAEPATETIDLSEQLHTARSEVGAVRLYGPDLRELIAAVQKDFGHERTIVTYQDDGTEKAVYSSEFLKKIPSQTRLKYLRLYIQDKDIGNLNKIASVELNADGPNQITVQGGQETWVRGKLALLESVIKRSEAWTLTSAKKYGLNINGLLVVLAIAAIPDLPFIRRVLMLLGAVGIINVVAFLHKRYISNATIVLQDEKTGFAEKYYSQIISVVITTFVGGIATLLYGTLAGYFSFVWKILGSVVPEVPQ